MQAKRRAINQIQIWRISKSFCFFLQKEEEKREQKKRKKKKIKQPCIKLYSLFNNIAILLRNYMNT